MFALKQEMNCNWACPPPPQLAKFKSVYFFLIVMTFTHSETIYHPSVVTYSRTCCKLKVQELCDIKCSVLWMFFSPLAKRKFWHLCFLLIITIMMEKRKKIKTSEMHNIKLDQNKNHPHSLIDKWLLASAEKITVMSRSPKSVCTSTQVCSLFSGACDWLTSDFPVNFYCKLIGRDKEHLYGSFAAALICFGHFRKYRACSFSPDEVSPFSSVSFAINSWDKYVII